MDTGELKVIYHAILREARRVIKVEQENGVTPETRAKIQDLNKHFNRYFGRDILIGDLETEEE